MRDPDDLRAFAREGWAAAARAKELYRRSFQKVYGPAEGIRIADELRKQVLAQRPDWPTEEERREDLAAHRRLLALFDRIEAGRRPPPR